MFKPLIEGDLLTGKVTNPTVQTAIHQARRAFGGKSEKDVLFLWKKIDTILSKWVAANRQTPPKPADYGLEDAVVRTLIKYTAQRESSTRPMSE